MNSISARPLLAMQFGDWRNGKLKFSNKVIAVADFFDASRKWVQIREAGDYRASNSPIVAVIDLSTGDQLAKISYNGRIWDASGKEICAS